MLRVLDVAESQTVCAWVKVTDTDHGVQNSHGNLSGKMKTMILLVSQGRFPRINLSQAT